MRGDSGVLLRTLPLCSYHAIYIDGSHRAPNVLRDLYLSFDLLLPNGILILDDYAWNMFPGQPLKTRKPAIDAFLEIYLGQYAMLHKGYQIALRKISPAK